jgi:NAD(P)-dependent dehydrogenase (short-subunit alcohol dehydrogenase family)
VPEEKAEGCALVTGASRGIGAATARALAADGWPVGVNYRSDQEGAERVVGEIEAAGGRAFALQADVADRSAADTLFTGLEEHFGPVLVLVNNAGVRADGLSPQMEDDAWDRVLETNLSAAFRTTRRALRTMMRERFGRVVNIASVVGQRANPGQANYAASKAGLVAFTHTRAHRHRADRGHRRRDAARHPGATRRDPRGGGCLRAIPRLGRGVLCQRHDPDRRWRYDRLAVAAPERSTLRCQPFP